MNIEAALKVEGKEMLCVKGDEGVLFIRINEKSGKLKDDFNENGKYTLQGLHNILNFYAQKYRLNHYEIQLRIFN